MTTATLLNDETIASPQMPDEPKSAPRARMRWWQFSLRALLVFTVLTAIVTAYTVSWIQKSEAQQEFVEQLSLRYGNYEYAKQESALASFYGWVESIYGPDYVRSLSLVEYNAQEGVLHLDALDCSQLERIDIDHAKTFEWKLLNKMPRLRELKLLGCGDETLRDVTPCKSLRKLSCFAAELNSLAGVENFPGLVELDCSCTKVVELNSVAQLPHLKELGLNEIPATDFSPLAKCRQLKILSLSRSNFAEMHLLKELKLLEKLWLDQTDVKDLTPLTRLENLQVLDVSQTWIETIEPLACFRKLQRLNLHSTKIEKLPDCEFPELDELIISDTKIADLNAVSKMPRLTVFACNYTEVGDLSPLQHCLQLERVCFCGTKVTNLEPLQKLPKLKSIRLSKSLQEKIGSDTLQQMLPKCEIETGPDEASFPRWKLWASSNLQ